MVHPGWSWEGEREREKAYGKEERKKGKRESTCGTVMAVIKLHQRSIRTILLDIYIVCSSTAYKWLAFTVAMIIYTATPCNTDALIEHVIA